MSQLSRRLLAAAAAAAALAALTACDEAQVGAGGAGSGGVSGGASQAKLGLMSSLPLVWPLGADVDAIASGRAATPWQREALAGAYAIAPLDTLSPIPALSPNAPDIDPLQDMTRLAVIQPRGLSPADNVALDDWVRAGGRLLLVLDPLLTGEYDLPLGDPRRPVDSALIPPVVARWGMTVSFPNQETEAGDYSADMMPGGSKVPLAYPGHIDLLPGDAAKTCVRRASAIAVCRVGKGRVTLIADAALFEHPELAGEGGAALRAVVREAVE